MCISICIAVHSMKKNNFQKWDVFSIKIAFTVGPPLLKGHSIDRTPVKRTQIIGSKVS